MKTKVQISRDCLVLFSEIKEVEAHVREIIGTIFELYIDFPFQFNFFGYIWSVQFFDIHCDVITKTTSIEIVF